MTECDNATIRDVLPDFVAGMLPADEREHVQAHVTSCDACIDEVALLRAMLAARPVAPAIDVARIVSALPRASTPLRLVTDSAPRDASIRALPVRRSIARSPLVRMAAAVAVAAIGGWSVLSNQGGVASAGPSVAAAGASVVPSVPVRDAALPDVGASAATVAMNDTQTAASRASGTSATGTTRATALSIGDLSEFSDDDLERMLDRLDKWDGATSAEPVPSVPIIPVVPATERGAR